MHADTVFQNNDLKFADIIIQHFLSVQYVLATDCFHLGYTEEGHCKGDVNKGLPYPTRLQWQIPKEVQQSLESFTAIELCDLHLPVFARITK